MTTREEAIHACLIDSSVYPDTPIPRCKLDHNTTPRKPKNVCCCLPAEGTNLDECEGRAPNRRFFAGKPTPLRYLLTT